MELIESGLIRGSGLPLNGFDGNLCCPLHSLAGIPLEDMEGGHVGLQDFAALRGLSQHGEGLDGIQAGLSQGGDQQMQERGDGFCVQGCVLPCESPIPGIPKGASAPPPLTPSPPPASSLHSLRGGASDYWSALLHPYAGPCTLLCLQPRPGPTTRVVS